MAKNPPFLERLFQGALDDIRHKVIEEPFFGREVTKDVGAAIKDVGAATPAPDAVNEALQREDMAGMQQGWTDQEIALYTAEYAPVHDEKFEVFLEDVFGKDTKQPEPAKTQEPAQEMER